MSRGELDLPRGTTLSRWLRTVRNVWDGGKPMLNERLVLRWAREHYNQTGRWPITLSGPLKNYPEENWAAIDVAMRNGRRGFPSRISLSQLLRRELGDAYEKNVRAPRSHAKAPQPRRVNVQR